MMRRRYAVLIALGIALVIAAWCARARRSRPVETVVPSQCQNLDQDENWFLWWWYGCPKPAAGGGGSGAG
jgi:hypothetical protein